MKTIQPRKPLGIDLTSLQISALRNALKYSAEPWGAGVTTGRVIRRGQALRLAYLGLVQSNGFHPVADGDGWVVQPERFKETWVITAKGRKWLRAYEAQP